MAILTQITVLLAERNMALVRFVPGRFVPGLFVEGINDLSK
jgi:hypothetical protein